jgi:hypothetical protein
VNERLVAMTIFILVAMVFVALGLPLARGSVPPNWIYGFRLPQTVKNPDLWYPANAYLGRWMIGLGAALFLFAVVIYFMPVTDKAYGLSLGIGLCVATVVMYIACMVRLAGLKHRRGLNGGGT